MAKQHGDLNPTDGVDDTTRGVHVIQGFKDEADEAARAAIVIAANDVGRVMRQTGGSMPGWYLAKATGSGLDKWHYLSDVQQIVFNLAGEIVYDLSGEIVLTAP